MNIIYLLLGITFIIILVVIWLFMWSVKTDQFEDLEGPAYQILMDDDDQKPVDTSADESSDNTRIKDNKIQDTQTTATSKDS